MDYHSNTDTIASVATSGGFGSISIIRISGEKAFDIANKIFVPKKLDSFLSQKESTIHYGHIVDEEGSVIDEVMVSKLVAPLTYTTQDVVEINCHGGTACMRRILSLVLSNGARQAEPGEFTKRAFLGGRIDLVQAQAVNDLISAKTDAARKNGICQLSGALSDFLNAIKDRLMDVIGRVEVLIQYPEYDVKDVDEEEMNSILFEAKKELVRLKNTFTKGDILTDGFKVVLCGKPNVGKSQLLNCLVGFDKAIVTPIAGTTRDMVDELITIGSVPVKLYDTAGIRESHDEVEKIGVKKAKDAVKNAHLILFVVDSTREIEKEDMDILTKLPKEKTLVVLNKNDLKENQATVNYFQGYNRVFVSALNNTGMEKIEEYIQECVEHTNEGGLDDIIVTSIRHKELIDQAIRYVDSAITTIESSLGVDMSEMDIREAWTCLAKITGEVTGEEIIDEMFSKFCLGK